ncbi:MAG: 50S ribosomal protein L11 methyltransferase [Chitinophagaceae bacterium]
MERQSIMKRYQQYIFATTETQQSEIISGLLSQYSFTGVEETENSLTVFFEEKEGNDEAMEQIAEITGAVLTRSMMDDQNWNSLWESNFEPVRVDDFVSIRADFHPPTEGVETEIVITPKMSFGTGHHATTWSMISLMRSIGFTGKKVFDFGTGTGILAILANKMGAASVTAIDNDSWSINNARENFERNNSSGITLILADEVPGKVFDIILANINKNVILAQLTALRKSMAVGGTLLISGLLCEDEEDIVKAANSQGLQVKDKLIRANWLCLKLSDI